MLYKSKKERPQKILLFFFILILFYLFHVYAEIHRIRVLYIVTFLFNNILEILIGPLLFLYIKSIFQNKKELIIKKNYTHFLPVGLYFVLVSIPFLLSILNRKEIFNYLKSINKYHNEISIAMMLYLLIYTFWSYRIFNKYRKAIKLHFSTIQKSNFKWIKLMLVGILLISCFDLITGIYEIYIQPSGFQTKYITVTLIIILLIYLSYFGIKQTTILLPDFLVNTISESKQKQLNNRLSSFKKNELSNLKASLESSMKVDKMHLDENLTLNKLATKLSISDKHLSAFLNQHLNITFYDYVNSYRITSVIDKLKSKEYKNITLLGIAYESGFKSKTSFNRIFKKETGLSPSAYIKSLHKH